MIRRPVLAALALAATTAGAEESLRDRLRALAAPAPVTGDLYAEDKARDLAMIDAQAARLFPGGAAIAVFVGPGCADCAAALADLQGVADGLDLSIAVHDVSQGDGAALMQAVALDMLPSYVMPDRLIRGRMPAFVLERYLSGG